MTFEDDGGISIELHRNEWREGGGFALVDVVRCLRGNYNVRLGIARRIGKDALKNAEKQSRSSALLTDIVDRYCRWEVLIFTIISYFFAPAVEKRHWLHSKVYITPAGSISDDPFRHATQQQPISLTISVGGFDNSLFLRIFAPAVEKRHWLHSNVYITPAGSHFRRHIVETNCWHMGSDPQMAWRDLVEWPRIFGGGRSWIGGLSMM